MLGWCTCPRTSTVGDVTVEGAYQRHASAATPSATHAAPAGKQDSMAASPQCDTKVPRLHLEALHRDGVLSKISVQQVRSKAFDQIRSAADAQLLCDAR